MPETAPHPHPLISVVLPAHDEEAALPGLIEEVLAALSGHAVEVIVVDDGSADGTWDAVRRLHALHPEVRGLRLSRNFGHQAAILAGLAAARGDAVVMMDSDGQHPAALLPMLVERWREGASVVQAVRTETDGEGAFKRLTSRWFYALLSTLAGVRIPPGSADFRLLSRPALEEVLAGAGPMPFLRGLIPWLGLPTAAVPFRAARRAAGRSSYSLRRMVRLSLDGILGFSVVPLRLAIALGIFVSGLSFLYLAYVVGIRLFSGRAVAGWASMAGLLSLLGGMQLFTLGVLGEYLGRLFLASSNRPRFVIRERVGADP